MPSVLWVWLLFTTLCFFPQESGPFSGEHLMGTTQPLLVSEAVGEKKAHKVVNEMKLEKRSWALHERWQTFKFSLSSTDFTKRRDRAGCSTFGGCFPFYCFVLTGMSLPAERRFDPSAVWSDHVSHIQIHLLSIYMIHLIMRAPQEDALCKADWSHTCQNSVLPPYPEVEVSFLMSYFSMTNRI